MKIRNLGSCKRCGQDIYKSCIRNILGIDDEDLSSTEVYKLINPFELSFPYYLCGECEKSLFSVDEQGQKKELSVESQTTSSAGVTNNKVDDIVGETQEIHLYQNICNSNRPYDLDGIIFSFYSSWEKAYSTIS